MSKKYLLVFIFGGLGLAVIFFLIFFLNPLEYSSGAPPEAEPLKEKPFVASHIVTPPVVRGVYLTNWLAGARDREGNFYMRERLKKLIDETELNAIVFDIKDDTGRIGFEVFNPELKTIGSEEKRIPDIREFLASLHEKGIYVIGRIAVFQDQFLVKARPELAIRRVSDGEIWQDRKGLAWLDPASREVWDYVLQIAKESYTSGFDEIQFDYVRFPTDGNISDIKYPFFDPAVRSRADTIRSFFSYIHYALAQAGIPHSVDLFGLTTTALDDMGIGQIFENAIPYFDFISPMVYPSHYASGSYGYANPNDYPYEIVKNAVESGVARLLAASSTPAKLRPWLQDFDVGGTYGSEEVRAQIKAVEDTGLSSWLLWDPSAKYGEETFK